MVTSKIEIIKNNEYFFEIVNKNSEKSTAQKTKINPKNLKTTNLKIGEWILEKIVENWDEYNLKIVIWFFVGLTIDVNRKSKIEWSPQT